MTDQPREEAEAAQDALSGEEEALREVMLCKTIDDLLVLLTNLQERRVMLEGVKDPGLEHIIRRIQRQTDVERAVRIVREWFDGFRTDRTDEIRRLREAAEEP
jgi:hypothetical protein